MPKQALVFRTFTCCCLWCCYWHVTVQGVKNAVPKTILQLMNVDGMTRENVASHLQKYRLYLKKLGGYPANAKTTPEALQQVQQVWAVHRLLPASSADCVRVVAWLQDCWLNLTVGVSSWFSGWMDRCWVQC